MRIAIDAVLGGLVSHQHQRRIWRMEVPPGMEEEWVMSLQFERGECSDEKGDKIRRRVLCLLRPSVVREHA